MEIKNLSTPIPSRTIVSEILHDIIFDLENKETHHSTETNNPRTSTPTGERSDETLAEIVINLTDDDPQHAENNPKLTATATINSSILDESVVSLDSSIITDSFGNPNSENSSSSVSPTQSLNC